MPQQNSPPTILLLDSELGFMLALAHELNRRKVAAFPSFCVQEAQSLIMHFGLEPDVLVIECSRPGACAFAKAVAVERPGVQVVAITSERPGGRKCEAPVAAQLCDPQDRIPERIGHCADVIQALLKPRRRRAHRAGGGR